MTRLTLIVLLLTILNVTFGQKSFNYHKEFTKILEQSRDKKSDYYYPNLLDRFNNNDNTLTNKEVLALQIGFTNDTNYKPYQTIETEREIKGLINQKDYKSSILACNKLLETNPVNFTALMEKGFAFMKLKNDSALFYKEKFMMILNANMTSGDGTIKNPYFVLSPIDGQTIITHILGGSIGMMGSGNDNKGYFVDILEMQREGKESATLYFNINHATDTMFSEEDLMKMEDSLKKSDKKKKR